MPQDDGDPGAGLIPHLNPQKPAVRWELILPLATRLLVWGIIFGLLALLSSFFTLIFLTFVFSYLQSGIVDRLSRRAPRMRIPVVFLTGGLFLSAIIAVSVLLAPKVYEQAAGFATAFFVYMERIDAETLELAERYPFLQEVIPELRRPEPVTAPPAGTAVPDGAAGVHQRAFVETPSGLLLVLLTGSGDAADGREAVKVLLDQLANISRLAVGMLSTFLLALLFSFLIVLDLPHLTANVRELENTRLRFIYVEVADNIYQFARVLGHAMQAQFYISCVNTVLTVIGLHLLGMAQHVAFLSVVVFLCGFIPFAGVFISSVPICLIALNMGGIDLVLLSILLITFIHLVEGYVLNPLIYGARLRINPVIVLIILTVGGKLFHIWGLILGVPVCTYLFGHAIRYRDPEPPPPIEDGV